MSRLRAFCDAPIALGALEWSPVRTTLIAKSIFLLGGDGEFELEPIAEPLSLDAFDARGEVIHPTDFAPYKPACDVVVGGLDALDRHAPGRLSIGAWSIDVEPTESLGPRESFCPAGDPTDPGVLATWLGGGVEPSRFQCAGPRQRVPWPTDPFPIELERGALTLGGRWVGPSPALAIDAPGRPRVAVALRLDTLILLPSDRRLLVVWRAVVDTPEAGPLHAYVHVPSRDPAATSVWNEVEIATAGALRRGEAVRTSEIPAQDGRTGLLGPPEGTVVASGRAPIAWPFQSPARPDEEGGQPIPGVSASSFEADLDQTRSVIARSPARTLPFRADPNAPPTASDVGGRARGSRAPAPPVHDLGALRTEGQKEIRPAWEAIEGTIALASPSNPGRSQARSPLADLPPARVVAPEPAFAVASPPWPVTEVPAPVPPPSTASLSTASPSTVEPPAKLGPIAPPDPSPPKEAAADRVTLIQREIWKGDRPLAVILAEHGLTESEWRALRRARKA